ncbi:HipA domain-containing protein [soil metagenome]
MSTSIRYLRLYLNLPDGTRRAIGYLSEYGDILRVSFEKNYIEDENRPTLSLGFQGSSEGDTQAILTSSRDERLVNTRGRLPVYFQNLLPEGHNRERLAEQRGCSPNNEFELLAAAGHDLMGALEVEPVSSKEGIPDVTRAWHVAQGLDVLEPGFVETPIEDGAALPGVVAKFSAVKDGRRYVTRRHGEAGSFIIKLPTSAHPDLVQNEFAGYSLCRALELRCAEASIISRADADIPDHVEFDQLLAVKRFDRAPGNRRVHMEELTQVLRWPSTRKYGNDLQNDYANVLRIIDRLSGNRVADVPEFVNRFVAFILMGNTDAHMKNWAFIYPDGRTPVLSPLYDPVCVAALLNQTDKVHYQHNRGIDNRLRRYSWDDLESLVEAAGISRVSRVLQQARATVKAAQARWPALLADAPESVRESVNQRLEGGLALTA